MTLTLNLEERRELIVKLALDRPLAHQILFAHRHPDALPDFHADIIRFLHAPHREGVVLAFRDAAKSTLAEEDIVIDGALHDFHNYVIVGASEQRAVERLAAVKREYEQNEDLRELFGDLVGQPWQETKIVLANGVCIQAIGRDQAVRGLKHLDWRPDRWLFDDVESRENVQTAEGRRKTMLWVSAEFLPACDVNYRGRVLATPIDKEGVPQRLIDDAGWPHLIIPIEHRGENGERVSSWPGRYSLQRIDEMKENYRRLGLMHVWASEYMMETTSESDRVFKPFPVVPQVRTFEATYAMVDPARTARSTSAATGVAVWSWRGSRLIIWRATAHLWLPSDIINCLFEIEEEFSPVWIGFEKTGLSEWAMQPIRMEQVRRGMFLPMKPLDPPHGQDQTGFIRGGVRGLQAFADAGEIEVAVDSPALREQLANFPSGRRDTLNALAYAPVMRPGQPVYDNFTIDHVVEDLDVVPGLKIYLGCHATNSLCTGVAFQIVGRGLRVLADFAVEGDASDAMPQLAREAAMALGAAPTYCVGPGHWERYTNVGLVQAIKALPAVPSRAVEPLKGRPVLRAELDRMARGMPAVKISRGARLTLNALAGGYSRMMTRQGVLTAEPEQGVYRTLMEGLESAIGMSIAAEAIDPGEEATYAWTTDGRRYRRYALASDRRR
jgi:hypothetical protein